MRYETRAYGTKDEIEAELKAAYTAPGRSDRRYGMIEEAAAALWRGETRIRYGDVLYVVVDGDEDQETLDMTD